MVMTSLKWRHNYILKFDFVIISFKSHHHRTSCHQYWRLTGAGGGKPHVTIPWLRPCPRPQKTFPGRKNQASYADFAQSCRNYAGIQKKTLIIIGFLVKFCFVQNYDFKIFNSKKGLKTFLVLRPQFFKSLRPSKVKTKSKTALAKTKIKTSKHSLKGALNPNFLNFTKNREDFCL